MGCQGPRHLPGVFTALYTVFIAHTTPISSVASRGIRPLARLYVPRLTILQTRSRSSDQSQLGLRDEAIRAREIDVVDEQGEFHTQLRTKEVLQSIDRNHYMLVQVAAGGLEKLPVCKIVKIEELREAARTRAKARANAVKDPSKVVKQLELNWAIDPNDLAHRLNKLQKFLEKGNRVEIMLANKRKGRRATPHEAQAVLREISEMVKSVNGAKELKPMDGNILGQATLFFEGKRQS